MRAIIQRVKNGAVEINNKKVAEIGQGLVVLLGIESNDSEDDGRWLANKISKLRIFDDENNVPNLDINQTKGDIIVVSQFTLYAKTKKGTRPSYIKAARPEQAIPLYESFKTVLNDLMETEVQSGEFGADMQVYIQNDGPFTIFIDTKNPD